jgi:putative transposase
MENDLLFFKNTIVRVVEVDSMDGLLVIDCLRKSMPFWVSESTLVGASRCEETELLKRAAPDLPKFEDITEARRKTARQRYALISPIVPLSGSKGGTI